MKLYIIQCRILVVVVRRKVEEMNWKKAQRSFWGNGNVWYLDDVWFIGEYVLLQQTR